MKHVTGIGGIFFKSDDPEKLYRWYESHLGITRSADGSGAIFEWREPAGDEGAAAPKNGMTVWSIFPRHSKYFDPSRSGFMINYRVSDLDGLLETLGKEGVQIEHREDYDYGRFAWIMDPEGNRIELWEPAEA
jgi:predicted enzyme related to lactoylglutathione lyase